MKVHIHTDRSAMGSAAAAEAAACLHAALVARGHATLVVATGTSQLEVLAALAVSDISWQDVDIFHLDEYCGVAADHPASFRRYLRERFHDLLPHRPAAFHWIGADRDPLAECQRLAGLVPAEDFDLVLCGIGENAHLAFNDPPADFEAADPYLVVALDEACRVQQVGEGWFPTIDAVPTQAISMSIRRLMAARTIVCSVPDTRKAAAVRDSVEGPVTPTVPASILQRHPDCRLHLDRTAAALCAGP
ncbi:MAG: glucosamine-6-phosphate deaminase [Planctomycetia bacterium]|nr:glucosamine-6-phosphate deaminase [Planctomycetia bacterium]